MRAKNPGISENDLAIMYDDWLDDEIEDFKRSKAAFNAAVPRASEMDAEGEGDELD